MLVGLWLGHPENSSAGCTAGLKKSKTSTAQLMRGKDRFPVTSVLSVFWGTDTREVVSRHCFEVWKHTNTSQMSVWICQRQRNYAAVGSVTLLLVLFQTRASGDPKHAFSCFWKVQETFLKRKVKERDCTTKGEMYSCTATGRIKQELNVAPALKFVT